MTVRVKRGSLFICGCTRTLIVSSRCISPVGSEMAKMGVVMFRLMLLGALAAVGWATVGDVLAADSPVPGYVAAATAWRCGNRFEAQARGNNRLCRCEAGHECRRVLSVSSG